MAERRCVLTCTGYLPTPTDRAAADLSGTTDGVRGVERHLLRSGQQLFELVSPKPVAAAADLEAVEGGTRVRLRWEYTGEPPLDEAAIQQIRGEKQAAFGRLATIVAGASPAIQQMER